MKQSLYFKLKRVVPVLLIISFPVLGEEIRLVCDCLTQSQIQKTPVQKCELGTTTLVIDKENNKVVVNNSKPVYLSERGDNAFSFNTLKGDSFGSMFSLDRTSLELDETFLSGSYKDPWFLEYKCKIAKKRI